MQNKHLMLNVLWLCLVVLYSCSTSIDGAPCNPDTNNCPDGQYCSSEGICKKGSPELKDISNIKDTQSYKDIEVDGNEDILNDVAQVEDVTYADGSEDILDISTPDIGGSDAGCKDECTSNVCKDNSVLKVCKDWDGDGCNEYKEVGCGEGATCQMGVCSCVTPILDCNNDMSDGCETNVNTDNSHCGSCTNDCKDNSVCNNGVCGCMNGFANCNGGWIDGCEVDLNTDVAHCGDCNTNCNNKNWSNVSEYGCSLGSCTIASCNTGYGDCDGQNPNGCEVNFNLPSSCGTNCANITNCGQSSTCTNGVCGCVWGYANCNSQWTDGCEINTSNDINNCGSCNNECRPSNVNKPLCKNGLCDYDQCKEFYLDIDGNRANGCEFWSNFPKRYDNNGVDDLPTVILKFGKEYLIAGNNKSLNQLWIVEVDKYGNIIEQRDIQLNGAPTLKTGIPYLDSTGNLKYLLGGTLQNSNRTDVFLVEFDSTGKLLLTKSYYINLPNPGYTFDLSRILYTNNFFVLLGSYNEKPMIMFLDPNLDISNAIYYDNDLGGGSGIFSDGYYQANYLYLTGSYKINSNPANKGVLVASYNVPNNITTSKTITLTGSNLTGNSITPPIINNGTEMRALIVGTMTNTDNNDTYGLLIDYTFSATGINMSVEQIKGNGGNLSFTKIAGIIGGESFYLIGGEYFTNNNYDSVLIKLKSNEEISNNIVVGGNKDEVFTDFFIDTDSILFVSSTSSFSSTKDIMAVRLNSGLQIENAKCSTDFAKEIPTSRTKLENYNILSLAFKANYIQNLTTGEPLKSISTSNGKAYNICSEPK